jgi:hypothetical protein
LFHDSLSRNTSVPDIGAIRSGERLGVTHGTGHFAFRVALGERLATVLLFLASREGQFDLGPTVLEVELQGDDRERLGLCLVVQVLYLVTVHEEFALAVGIVTAKTHREGPRGDVHLEQP